jgi:hypothetical protein
MTDHVDILLGTYNGQAYLEMLLASIASQTHTDWTLHVRDDGSTDRSRSIVTEFARQRPGQVVLHADADANLGPARNFGRLMTQVAGPYITFCDQDDMWLPERVGLLAYRMGKLEEEVGADIPLLVHSDLKVVDEKLELLNESFWDYQHLDPNRCELPRLLTQNVVTGCATMINRALADRTGTIPEHAVMHDWWIALVATLFGRVDAIHTPTLLYRQHGANDTGAKRWSGGYIARQAAGVFGKDRRARFRRTTEQARALLDRYRDELSEDAVEILDAYARLAEVNPIARRVSVLKHGFFKQGFRRNLGHWLSV